MIGERGIIPVLVNDTDTGVLYIIKILFEGRVGRLSFFYFLSVISQFRNDLWSMIGDRGIMPVLLTETDTRWCAFHYKNIVLREGCKAAVPIIFFGNLNLNSGTTDRL